MSVNSSGVPLFAGVEDIDDMFITTMEEMDKEVIAEGEQAIWHPVYEYLKKNNLIEYRANIGTHVPVKLRDKANPTTQWVSGYDDAKNIPSNVLSEAKFAYGHLTGVQMYNREELVKNSGPEQLVDLVEEKQEQLDESLDNDFADAIMGAQDADGRKIMGLGRIMAYDQSCGGIDPTAPGKSYWNPQKIEKSAGVNFALATELEAGMRKGVRRCTKAGLGSSPDVFMAGEDLYDALQAHYSGKLQVTLDELKKGDWGDFEMFSVNGRTIIWEPAMSAKTGWFVNFKKWVKLRVHSGTNFKYTDWQMMEGKVQAKKRNCLLYAALYAKRRSPNGFVTFD